MKFLVKIEEAYNRLYVKLVAWLQNQWLNCVPEKTRQSLHDRRQSAITKFRHYSAKSINFCQQSGKKTKNFFASENLLKIKETIIGQQRAIGGGLKKVASIKRSDVKEFFNKARNNIKSNGSKLKSKCSVKTVMLRIGFSSVVLGSLGLIVYNIQDIGRKAGYRAPAAIPPMPFDVRPRYYKQHKRQFKVINISVPIIRKGVSAVRSMKIDIIVQTNNRSTKNFFLKREAILRDHLYSHVKPFEPQFMMGREGRSILVEKIANEFNKKLKELQAPGKVEKVYLSEMLGD